MYYFQRQLSEHTHTQTNHLLVPRLALHPFDDPPPAGIPQGNLRPWAAGDIRIHRGFRTIADSDHSQSSFCGKQVLMLTGSYEKFHSTRNPKSQWDFLLASWVDSFQMRH